MTTSPLNETQGRAERRDASTADLLRELIDESSQLVRAEVDLLRDEVYRELEASRRAALALGVSAVLGLQGLTLLLVALAQGCPHPVWASSLLGVFLLISTGATFFFGYHKLPRRPLGEARDRLATDIKELKEHVHE